MAVAKWQPRIWMCLACHLQLKEMNLNPSHYDCHLEIKWEEESKKNRRRSKRRNKGGETTKGRMKKILHCFHCFLLYIYKKLVWCWNKIKERRSLGEYIFGGEFLFPFWQRGKVNHLILRILSPIFCSILSLM